MAVNINGTTGISGFDGSASAASIAGTDANTGLSFASDTVNINTGGVTRATIDSGGKLNLTSNIKWASADGYVYSYNGGSDGQVRSGVEYSGNNQTIRYFTGTNERARFLSGGQFIIGGTAVEAQGALTFEPNRDDGAGRITFNRANTTAVSVVVEFQNNNSQVGVINHDHTGCGIFTTSDYRAKENVLLISDGITRLKTLKPYKFNFIADATKTVDGFFAHEVQSVVPEAITGTKDEVDSDNNPVYQAIDQSKLVPLLTAALQEAVAKIEVLEAKVAALEAG